MGFAVTFSVGRKRKPKRAPSKRKAGGPRWEFPEHTSPGGSGQWSVFEVPQDGSPSRYLGEWLDTPEAFRDAVQARKGPGV